MLMDLYLQFSSFTRLVLKCTQLLFRGKSWCLHGPGLTSIRVCMLPDCLSVWTKACPLTRQRLRDSERTARVRVKATTIFFACDEQHKINA